MSPAHRDDVSFERAFDDVPLTLVDDERRLAMITGVLIRLGHDPCRGIGNTLKSEQLESSDMSRTLYTRTR